MNATIKILNELRELKRELSEIKEKLNADKSKMVGIARASEITGLSKAAIRQRAQRGQIPCSKDNTGHLIFSTNDLNNLII